jgi:hypothetical protein
MSTGIEPQTTTAVSTEPAPVTEPVTVQTQEPSSEVEPQGTEPIAAVNPDDVPGSEPTKAVKELIAQRQKRQKAEQEAAYWRGVAEGRVAPQTPPATQEVKPQEYDTPPVKPVLDSFETYEQFEAAKDDYLIKQAEFNMAQRFKHEQSRVQTESKAQTFNRRLQEAAKNDPTITDIVQDPTLPISNTMVPILQESELAPQILKYLHNNRQEAARIASLPPVLAAKELGAIEARIQFKPAPTPPRQVSVAPEPLTTVATTSSTTVDEDDLPISEFIKRRNMEQYGKP